MSDRKLNNEHIITNKMNYGNKFKNTTLYKRSQIALKNCISKLYVVIVILNKLSYNSNNMKLYFKILIHMYQGAHQCWTLISL